MKAPVHYLSPLIWNLGTPNSYMNLHTHTHTNSYIYIYIYIYIHIWILMIIWIHRLNSCMKWSNEFMSTWIHEYMNSCIWIQIYRFQIHIRIHQYMNSDIWIHSIKSEFMNLFSYTWIHDMNSFLKISILTIHGFEFSSEIWHMNWFKCIQKNQNWDFCYEFIYELNFNEFAYLDS